MRDQQLSPTRHCKGTAHTSAGVCCRETRCMSDCRCRSTDDYTPTLWCRPLRLSGNLPESFQCLHTACTRHKYLSYLSQHISDVGTTQPVFIIAEKLTRCSAIAERPRCRVRYSFGHKYKNGTGRQYFTDIIGLSLSIVVLVVALLLRPL